MLKNQLVIISALLAMTACGGHKSNKAGAAPDEIETPAPVETPVPQPEPEPSPTPTPTPAHYEAVQAIFEGAYVGISQGKVHNFDNSRQPVSEMKILLENTAKAGDTKKDTLVKRPQRIDRISDEFILLQRPTYRHTDYRMIAGDSYLINTRTGLMWKFDEFFPDYASLQYVENGGSKKLYFLATKNTPYMVGYSNELGKAYNFTKDETSGIDCNSCKTPYIVRIDLSDPEHVSLRPITDNSLNTQRFVVDKDGAVVYEGSAVEPPYTQSTLVTMESAADTPQLNGISIGSSSSSRLQKDAKNQFWLLGSNGMQKLDFVSVDGRPTMQKGLQKPYETNSWVYFNWDYQTYRWADLNLFVYASQMLVFSDDLSTVKHFTLHNNNSSSLISTLMRDTAKLLIYGKARSSSDIATLSVFDLRTLSSQVVDLEAAKVFGAFTSMESTDGANAKITTREGGTSYVYSYNVKGEFQQIEKISSTIDTADRILVPVSLIP